MREGYRHDLAQYSYCPCVATTPPVDLHALGIVTPRILVVELIDVVVVGARVRVAGL